MIPQVIIYEQPFYPEGEPPRDYYDPRTLQSDKPFNIKPDEEVLLVVSGSGYRFMDDVIYPLHERDDTGAFIPLAPLINNNYVWSSKIYLPITLFMWVIKPH